MYLKFFNFLSSPSWYRYLLPEIKQPLAKTRMLELRIQRKHFVKTVFSLTGDKARDHFSVAEQFKTMDGLGHEPLERLPWVFEQPPFLEVI